MQAEARGRRVLFVLTNDYGELFNALYLVMGTGVQATFVMPPRLHQLNQATFTAPVRRYRSARELHAVVRGERPEILLLFSGYLFGVNKLLDAASLGALLGAWEAAGIRIGTSDPTLGIASRMDATTVDPSHARRAWLAEHLAEVYARLARFPHLYLAPTRPLPHPHASFYNPSLILSPEGLEQCSAVLGRWAPIEPRRRRWLFVLSPEDLKLQVEALGREGFTDRLVAMLAAAAAAGRQPVLLAPMPCTADVGRHRGRPANLAALVACNFNLFLALLYESEHVFYWNMFSASIVGRALNRRPFFLFDEGHLARYLKPYREWGLEHLYHGCSPPFLDPAAPLDPSRLEALSRQQASTVFEPARRHLSRSPSPEETLARCFGEP